MKPEDLKVLTKTLVQTALGEKNADLVLENSNLIDVYTGEILEGMDVAIKNGRIAMVGDATHTISSETNVIDVSRRYLSPGFLDGHVHIDDSMGTVTEFARVVLPKGTTGVFMDPHEIANVLGLRGVRLMLEEAENVPLKVYSTVPSCVPATSPDFETTGARIGVDEVEEALGWERIVGLGELMNFSKTIAGEEKVHEMISETLKSGKVVDGHAPALTDEKLNAYIGSGITSCHESTSEDEALEKVRQGMYLMIREGFEPLKNLSDLIGIVTGRGIDSRRVSLVTDDRHPGDLVGEGHIDNAVRRAVEEGADPVEAIQMVSLNTAERFNVDKDIGGIAPGKVADIVVLENISDFTIRKVLSHGEVIAEDGKLLSSFESYEYPKYAKDTVNLSKKLTPESFGIEAGTRKERVLVRAIGVDEKSPKTEKLKIEVQVENGLALADWDKNISKIAVIERHKGTGNTGLGFVKGFGFDSGATASTIAHDSHNIMVIGVNERDMALAGNKLAEVGGGIIVVDDGEVLELVDLPIAGLMSSRPLEATHQKIEKLKEAWREISCDWESPFPTMILLALPVLPEIRITDKGLIDTINFEFVDILAR